MVRSRNEGVIELQPLETNLDVILSRSQESLYSVQTCLESIEDDRSIYKNLLIDYFV